MPLEHLTAAEEAAASYLDILVAQTDVVAEDVVVGVFPCAVVVGAFPCAAVVEVVGYVAAEGQVHLVSEPSALALQGTFSMTINELRTVSACQKRIIASHLYIMTQRKPYIPVTNWVRPSSS